MGPDFESAEMTLHVALDGEENQVFLHLTMLRQNK